MAWNLRRIRVERGLSQEKLAHDSGIDRAYLGTMERAKQNPTIDTLDKVAERLGVSIAELFREPAADEPEPLPLRAGRRPER